MKVRGFRIELGEIEAVAGGPPGGARAPRCWRGRSCRAAPRLVAYVVPADGRSVDAAALRAFLAGAAAGLHGAGGLRVILAALPLTPTGKVDRRALAPRRCRGRRSPARQPAAPRTPLERVLAAIWPELLGLPAIGVHDDFFALGGHSLLAMQLVSRVRAAVRASSCRCARCSRQPTLAALAAHLEAGAVDGAPARAADRAAGGGRPAPLSFAQERLWFLDSFLPGSSEYNIPTAVRLHGDVDVAALAGALRQLEARHESLRTTFARQDGEPVQRIAPPREQGQLALVDLRGVAAGPAAADDGRAVERLVLALAAREAKRPFDLARGPLYRVVLLRLGAGEHALLFNIHHIIADAWSLEIWFRELGALYAAVRERRPSPLAPLAVQYADYAVWQRERLSGEVLSRQMAWWREHLAGAPRALDLPADRPRPKVRRGRGAIRRGLAYRAAPVHGLSALARRHGATHFMTLLAAFELLLCRYTGQADLVVGCRSPTAGGARSRE